MALARWRSADGDRHVLHDGAASEYRFRDMHMAIPTGTLSAVKGTKFAGKMKKLGMGILELVLGRK